MNVCGVDGFIPREGGVLGKLNISRANSVLKTGLDQKVSTAQGQQISSRTAEEGACFPNHPGKQGEEGQCGAMGQAPSSLCSSFLSIPEARRPASWERVSVIREIHEGYGWGNGRVLFSSASIHSIFKKFYWTRFDLQRCVIFRCTAK